MILSYKGLLVTSILSPLAYFLLFSYNFSTNFSQIEYGGHVISYLNFLFIGIIAMQSFNQFGMSIIKTSNDKRFGMVRMLFSTNITTADYFFAKVIGSIIIVTLQILLLFIGGIIIANTITFTIPQILILLSAVILGTTFWNLSGSIIGLYSKAEDVRDMITGLLSLPLLFASSVFYNVDNLPSVLKIIAKNNPLSFIADIIRDFFVLSIIRIDLLAILLLMIALQICFIIFFADSFLKRLQ